jgi:hypothetical protein
VLRPFFVQPVPRRGAFFPAEKLVAKKMGNGLSETDAV